MTSVHQIIYSVAKNYVITLKLLENSQHNMDRENVVNRDYAEFCCDKAYVISIIDKITGEEILKIETDDTTFGSDNIKYFEKDSIIVYNDYHANNPYLYSSYLHFFLTYEPAFFYNLELTNFLGIYKQWHGNGNLFTEFYCKNGVFDGTYKEYHENGQLWCNFTYKNGEKENISRQYYEDGSIYTEIEYNHGKKHGICRKYYENGYHITHIYKNDKKLHKHECVLL